VSLYKYDLHEIGKRNIRLAPLNHAKHISLTWNKLDVPIVIDDKKITHLPQLAIEYVDKTVIVKDEVKDNAIIKNVNVWIDNAAWSHLRFLFPDFNYLFDFLKIETKDVYDSCIYHGAANYQLVNPNSINEPKNSMRGYSGKKNVTAFEYDIKTDSLIKIDTYDNDSIPNVFLSRLKNSVVGKLPTGVIPIIIKQKEYAQKDYFNRSKLNCGDESLKNVLPNYCSLSQYTFSSEMQLAKWRWAAAMLKRNYNETFEVFFTNGDGTLRYQEMIETLSAMIDAGVKAPIKELQKKHVARITINGRRKESKTLAANRRNELVFTKKSIDKQEKIVVLKDKE
jgi:hypothetical protein